MQDPKKNPRKKVGWIATAGFTRLPASSVVEVEVEEEEERVLV